MSEIGMCTTILEKFLYYYNLKTNTPLLYNTKKSIGSVLCPSKQNATQKVTLENIERKWCVQTK